MSDFWHFNGGPVINLDHVVSVHRMPDDKLMIGTVCPGITASLNGDAARAFLDAIGRRIAEREAARRDVNHLAVRPWWRAIADRIRRRRA